MLMACLCLFPLFVCLLVCSTHPPVCLCVCCQVFYVDYGNSEELSIKSQSLIAEQPLKHIPQLSLRFRVSSQTAVSVWCALTHLIYFITSSLSLPLIWKDDYGIKLSQLVLDEEISITVSNEVN